MKNKQKQEKPSDTPLLLNKRMPTRGRVRFVLWKLFLRLDRKDMDRVQAMLALDAGDVPVYMHLPAEKMTLLCPRTSWSSGSERTVQKLKEALDAENVVMKRVGS